MEEKPGLHPAFSSHPVHCALYSRGDRANSCCLSEGLNDREHVSELPNQGIQPQKKVARQESCFRVIWDKICHEAHSKICGKCYRSLVKNSAAIVPRGKGSHRVLRRSRGESSLEWPPRGSLSISIFGKSPVIWNRWVDIWSWTTALKEKNWDRRVEGWKHLPGWCHGSRGAKMCVWEREGEGEVE